ncbi:MAG: hypothetical protein GX323_05530 [Clostridiales bacterium]|nr:hypothetical protein [Clostridiales bacterium]
MKYLSMVLKKYGEKKTGIFLFSVGAFVGLIFSRIFKGLYWNKLDLLNAGYFDFIKEMEINYRTLRNYVLWKNFRNFILIWGLSFTKLGIGLISLMILYFGIQSGFFVSVLIMGYGLKGILLVLGYTFPQIIVYLPVLVLSFQGGYWLCRDLYFSGIYRKSRLELVAKYIVFIIFLGLLLFIGALLETYVGSFFLIRILGLF